MCIPISEMSLTTFDKSSPTTFYKSSQVDTISQILRGLHNKVLKVNFASSGQNKKKPKADRAGAQAAHKEDSKKFGELQGEDIGAQTICRKPIRKVDEKKTQVIGKKPI